MFGTACFGVSLWWIFPLVMIALCFFMMRRHRGSMMCGHDKSGGETAKDILDRRYAFGEINKEEYEEKSKHIYSDE